MSSKAKFFKGLNFLNSIKKVTSEVQNAIMRSLKSRLNLEAKFLNDNISSLKKWSGDAAKNAVENALDNILKQKKITNLNLSDINDLYNKSILNVKNSVENLQAEIKANNINVNKLDSSRVNQLLDIKSNKVPDIVQVSQAPKAAFAKANANVLKNYNRLDGEINFSNNRISQIETDIRLSKEKVQVVNNNSVGGISNKFVDSNILLLSLL